MKHITLLLTAFAVLWGFGTLSAQEQHNSASGHDLPGPADTAKVHNVGELFSKGEVHGHIRNYFMVTWNHRQLSDNFANAIGAELGYRTATFRGFRFGFAGLFTYNLFSSGMDERDPIAGKYPKLELELFDIKDPDNRDDLDRLDELYLEYSTRHLQAKVGRFSYASPLMNPQDTRMKPYSFQGVEFRVPLGQKLGLNLAWFDHFSPRSTVFWFSAAESFGLYSAGTDAAGNPSPYPHHISTKGVAIAGLLLSPLKGVKAEVWNYWIENISNTAYGRSQWQLLHNVSLGVEGLFQLQAGNGGSPVTAYAYFQDQQQWLAGGMLAYEPKNRHLSLNYLHIGKGGQFLFPREWGREQFFATLPRGRMEGSGNADLLVAKAKRIISDNFTVELALARGWNPPVDDYRYNKYGAASYWSWVSDLRYQPHNPALKGLSFRLLYIGRISPDEEISLQDMYYKTNFHNLNFVTQITF